MWKKKKAPGQRIEKEKKNTGHWKIGQLMNYNPFDFKE